MTQLHRKAGNIIRNVENEEEAPVLGIRAAEMRFDEAGLSRFSIVYLSLNDDGFPSS